MRTSTHQKQLPQWPTGGLDRVPYLLFALAVLALPRLCHAAQMGIAELSGKAPGVIAAPVAIQVGAEQVAALQFDLHFDASRVEILDIVPGPAAEAAKKDVNWTANGQGRSRVILAGLNRNILASGTVAVATYRVRELPGSEGATLEMKNVILSDAFGTEVPSSIVETSRIMLSRESASAVPPGGLMTSGGAAGSTPARPFRGALSAAALLLFASLAYWYSRPAKKRKRRS